MGQTGDPIFWGGGSVIWIFSVWLIFKKWQLFFSFFHNSQCWYSISVNTQKTGHPNFWGTDNLKRFHTTDIYEMVAIFKLSIMANVDIQFHWHSENWRPRLWGLVIWNSPVQSMFMIWWLFFIFFIMANIDILFPLTLGKPDTQTLGNFTFFHTIDIYKMVVILHFFHNSQCWYSKWCPFFNLFIMADADIPFPVTLRNFWIFCWFRCFLNFLLVQFSLPPILGSHPRCGYS